MKIFLFALLGSTFASSFAVACPSFSGVYELANSATAVRITISQDQCNSIRFFYYYPSNGGRASQSYVADQVERITADDDSQTVSQASLFSDSTFVNQVNFLNKQTQKATRAVSTYHVDTDGSVGALDQYYNSSGVLYSQATRVFQKPSP